MQVFKAYFKVLNQYKGSVIRYITIFVIILYFFIVPALAESDNQDYVEKKCAFTVFDYDNSQASKGVIDYLSKRNTLVEIKADEKEVIQDELYYRNIVCALRIPKGFERHLKEGTAEDFLEVVTIPGTRASAAFETQLDGCLSAVATYIDAGFSVSEAMEKAEKALDVNVEVSLSDGGDDTVHTGRYYYYNYLAWVLMCVMIEGISPCLLVFSRDEMKKRMECSAYRFSRFNKELMLSVFVSGLMICGVFVLVSVAGFKNEMLNVSGLLNIINMLCYMLVALAIAFLTSRLLHRVDLLAMVSNIISLGMAFLCGIFVPRQFLGDNIVKVAHFLPAYWYSEAVTALDRYTSGMLPDIMKYMGVELLFAVVLVVLALAISRKQQMK